MLPVKTLAVLGPFTHFLHLKQVFRFILIAVKPDTCNALSMVPGTHYQRHHHHLPLIDHEFQHTCRSTLLRAGEGNLDE